MTSKNEIMIVLPMILFMGVLIAGGVTVAYAMTIMLNESYDTGIEDGYYVHDNCTYINALMSSDKYSFKILGSDDDVYMYSIGYIKGYKNYMEENSIRQRVNSSLNVTGC